eukprot:4404288-Pyramimonas_sp.AAC.1
MQGRRERVQCWGHEWPGQADGAFQLHPQDGSGVCVEGAEGVSAPGAGNCVQRGLGGGPARQQGVE